MSSKREREKLQAERHQLIIQELLRDEDNKYCVDCDAKGPRWASWNIGVFLCIRCAGIHRNLGVHISKVKSVNLDTWTLPQLAMMRDMGNSRARAIYEARLPDGFRRPQSDSALETFIRSKYEQRRYISPDYVPIKPDLESLMKEIQRLEQAVKKRHSPNAVILGHPPSTAGSGTTKQVSNTENKASEKDTVKTTEADLLGLDLTQSKPSAGQPAIELFDNLTTTTVTTTEANQVSLASSVAPVTASKAFPTGSSTAATSQTSANDLLGLDLRGSAAPPPVDTVLPTSQSTGVEPVAPVAKVTKDSILALYQQSPNPAPAFSLIPGTNPASGFAQFAPSSQSSNWQFTTAVGSSPASNTNMAAFGEIQMPSGQSGMSSLSQPIFASPNTLNPTFTAQSNGKVDSLGFKSVQQNRLVPSSPGVWPDSSSNSWAQSAPTFPNSFIAQQPAASASGVPGVGPFTDRAPLPAWNMNQFAAPTAPVNPCGNPNFFMPAAFNSGAPSHEAYLSQVQSQLASLHVGGTVNNQQ